MRNLNDTLRSLQTRIRNGDRAATELFRRNFMPAAQRIVRNALRSDSRSSPLVTEIRALARQAATPDLVASRLCELMIGTPHLVPTGNDTFRYGLEGEMTIRTRG